jgi:hypothetical protein
MTGDPGSAAMEIVEFGLLCPHGHSIRFKIEVTELGQI